jgi:hypothetical protein
MQKSSYFLNLPVRLIVGFLLMIGACSDDDGHNVQIVNDDLEGSIAWEFINVTPTTHDGEVVSSVSASSSHSLATTSSIEQAGGFSFWRLVLTPSDIPVGASLELSVKVKVTNVTGNGAYIALRGDDNSPNSLFFKTTQGSLTIKGTADFATYSLRVDSYPEGVKQLYIFLLMDGTSKGSVNFDDISLVSHHK